MIYCYTACRKVIGLVAPAPVAEVVAVEIDEEPLAVEVPGTVVTVIAEALHFHTRFQWFNRKILRSHCEFLQNIVSCYQRSDRLSCCRAIYELRGHSPS